MFMSRELCFFSGMGNFFFMCNILTFLFYDIIYIYIWCIIVSVCSFSDWVFTVWFCLWFSVFYSLQATKKQSLKPLRILYKEVNFIQEVQPKLRTQIQLKLLFSFFYLLPTNPHPLLSANTSPLSFSLLSALSAHSFPRPLLLYHFINWSRGLQHENGGQQEHKRSANEYRDCNVASVYNR